MVRGVLYKRYSLFVSLLLTVLVVAGLLRGNIVYAQESEIGATLCDGQPPTLQITSPASGAVVSTETTNIEGTADRASSVTVTVNTHAVATVPVSFSGPFSVPVPLLPGSNTIEVTAYLACNNTDYTTTFALQYIPPPPPPEPPVPGPTDTSDGGTAKESRRSWWEATFGDIKDNLGGKPDPDTSGEKEGDRGDEGKKSPVSYVVMTRSWVSLLLTVGLLLLALLPRRYYRNSKRLPDEQRVVVLVRFIAFVLAIVCMFILQL